MTERPWKGERSKSHHPRAPTNRWWWWWWATAFFFFARANIPAGGMRTRSQSSRPEQTPGGLSEKSREGVERVLKRKGGSSKLKKREGCVSGHAVENNGEKEGETSNVSSRIEIKGNPADEPDWEDGIVSFTTPNAEGSDGVDGGLNQVTIEFTAPASEKRKVAKRASAEDKELAELVHKVHLLCLLARGRMIDEACDDPLLQASLISLLPAELPAFVNTPTLTAKTLEPIINWFNGNFHVQGMPFREGAIKSNMMHVLDTREGTAEEVAALSVALFRALNLTARFVGILDVASLKPDSSTAGGSDRDGIRLNSVTISSPTKIAGSSSNHPQSIPQASETPKLSDEASNSDPQLNTPINEICQSIELATEPESCSTKLAKSLKRKSDIEFELQLEMALCASAAVGRSSDSQSDMPDLCCMSSDALLSSNFKKIKTEKPPGLSIKGSNGAAWSRKSGPPLFWAEVFCDDEALTGRWIHVDAANAIIDGEEKVESSASACRKSLRYVIAFAGQGAKDVTRRYCMKWYIISPQRINSQWWEAVLQPLRELEKNLTDRQGGNTMQTHDGDEVHGKEDNMPGTSYAARHNRSHLEDMELNTRALTEQLPTNQQAYKNHPLYAMERWLTKYQILHPKGPILGYCSGHPIYPRTCVKNLQTRQRWLREGLQVKQNEDPVKIVKDSRKSTSTQNHNIDLVDENGSEGTLELYGRWQTEPLRLPHAVDGIVPKNDRGQVDVWSEKCIPPGTVHLRYPRIVPVVKRLELDFAPAMVGFEFRNGRSMPIFEGVVICSEFKDAVMEAYVEEEERRQAEEKRRNEAQAISRWYQLLSSIITRQRLKGSYEDQPVVHNQEFLNCKNESLERQHGDHDNVEMAPEDLKRNTLIFMPSEQGVSSSHEHTFPIENQSFDEKTSVRTKRCPCGFSICLEEL